MGWWTEPVGGKKAAPARSSKPSRKPSGGGKVVATTKPTRGGRCQVCGKTPRQCTCHLVGDAIPTRRGAPKDRIESNGVIWCGACNSRVNPNNGVCMNMKCSTR